MTDLERLRAVAAFLSEFESPAFTAGEIVPVRRGEDGVLLWPYAGMSRTVTRFEKMLYANGWITFAEWMQWSGTEEARRLEREPDALARADAEQLRRLLTMCVRRDRFVTGALLRDFETGLMLRIARRADVLVRELSEAS